MKLMLVLLLSLLLVGCVQSPTQTTDVIDNRPGLAFDLTSPAARSYELKIDGLSYGPVEQYSADQSRLKIIDGMHKVELFDNGRLVYRQKIYLGAGSNRVLKVGNYE